MFTFDIEKWTPKFILNDRNGYALAKAIEAGLQSMNDSVLEGFKCIADYDTMPEWRLDELAWEYDCLYDYNADVASKREWIRNASQLYLAYGTPAGIAQYLMGVFDHVVIEEGADYDADPFHFRVILTGVFSEASDAWAKKAIAEVKNVRSVLDGVHFRGNKSTASMWIMAGVASLTRGSGGYANNYQE